MKNYKNILVAVELNPTVDEILLERAQDIAKNQQGRLSLVHAVENMGGYGTVNAYSFVTEIEEELLQDRHTKFANLAKSLNIPAAQQHLKLGTPAAVIKEIIKTMQADLIVIGSHERHGLAALFGSTTDSILHGVECDLLAIHLLK